MEITAKTIDSLVLDFLVDRIQRCLDILFRTTIRDLDDCDNPMSPLLMGLAPFLPAAWFFCPLLT